jgi:hypothetical protein
VKKRNYQRGLKQWQDYTQIVSQKCKVDITSNNCERLQRTSLQTVVTVVSAIIKEPINSDGIWLLAALRLVKCLEMYIFSIICTLCEHTCVYFCFLLTYLKEKFHRFLNL